MPVERQDLATLFQEECIGIAGHPDSPFGARSRKTYDVIVLFNAEAQS
jgi:hypothetical protein